MWGEGTICLKNFIITILALGLTFVMAQCICTAWFTKAAKSLIRQLKKKAVRHVFSTCDHLHHVMHSAIWLVV